MINTPLAIAVTYGLLGYETINGRATGWEWGATQPQPALEPDPANPRLQVVTQDVKEGNQALKATVYPYDNFNRGARAKVVHYNRQQETIIYSQMVNKLNIDGIQSFQWTFQ